MATQTYVGARYVPKFMGEYDSTTVYEALSVVDNGLGTSYISKIPTPANTPLTDTTHWALYGASSGAIFDLQTRMTAAEGDIDTVEGDILTINGALDTLDDRVDANGADIAKLKTYHDDVFLLVSDSYGDPVNGRSWFTYFKSYLGLDDDHCIAAHHGGYGFNPANYNAPFKNLIDPNGTVEGGVPSDIDTDAITKIIVAGGFNDRLQTIPNIESAISEFCSFARTTYPNAKIYIAPVGWSFNKEYLAEMDNGKYITAYKNAPKYGAICLTNTEYIMHNFAYFNEDTSSTSTLLGHDYVHPNNNGASAIASGIINALSGSCNVDYPYTVSGRITPTGISTGTVAMATKLVNNMLYVYVAGGRIQKSSGNFALTNAAENEIELATINSGLFMSNQDISIPVNCWCGGGDVVGNKDLQARIGIKGGKLILFVSVNDEMNPLAIIIRNTVGAVPAFMF